MGTPFISIVIPVLNDAGPLVARLSELRSCVDCEVIIANGDPEDVAVGRLRELNPEVTWVESAPGRARQMNAGAAVASGEWLIFLHADASLGTGWSAELRAAADRGAVGGCFSLRIDASCWQPRLIEAGVRWRVRWLGLAYGDQALFIRRTAFENLAGYRLLPLMEDADLVKRMHRYGRWYCSGVAVSVSARRWERDGWIRRTVANLLILGLYLVGWPPERLKELYPVWRSPTR